MPIESEQKLAIAPITAPVEVEELVIPKLVVPVSKNEDYNTIVSFLQGGDTGEEHAALTPVTMATTTSVSTITQNKNLEMPVFSNCTIGTININIQK